MIEPEPVDSSLLELNRVDDPRGGAAAWALMSVGMMLVVGAILTMIWMAS